MTEVDLTKFNKAIEAHRMMDSWGDGLFVTTEEEKKERAENKYNESLNNFIRMMKSSKNNKTDAYERWAINKSLGLINSKVNHGMKTKKVK